ncbi:MFS general substrate transporter [Dendrothele bispora CBS 962.96]|uniref:MFS general substrate transporter n=1 Tax=Dendrothele bispora (strain CBS 962.96) TaxID=1314807 RepID=A0A4S8M0P0_DENBC|nr:MFS general substrate transporter [Dendrothele bispora CBS 962.96]
MSASTPELKSVQDEKLFHDQDGLSPLASLSLGRKRLLLSIFCFAQFLDTFNNSALFSAIPRIAAALNITNANSVWLLSAYQLTFAAFLLSSGRLSDVYNAKYVFILGAAIMGFLALGAGFVRDQIVLIVLRAIMGIGAALTVPSALQLIITMHPEPVEQAAAVLTFVGTTALGNSNKASGASELPNKFRRLDPVGVLILSVGLLLLIFAVISGSATGWGSARVIGPLVISIFMIAMFFVWEARIPEEFAAVPPSMWRYKNFGVHLSIALMPFLWWGAVMLVYSWLWQVVYGYSAIKTAVRFLPINIMGVFALVVGDFAQKTFRLKWVICTGMVITMAGTALLPFGNSPDKYWRFIFPGFLLGTTGVTFAFTTANITIFKVTPPRVAGTVGALFNCFLNLGIAVGAAIITSIQTSVEQHRGGPTSYDGRAAGFWFLFAVVTALTIGVFVFMEDVVPPVKKDVAEELATRAQLSDSEMDFAAGNLPT